MRVYKRSPDLVYRVGTVAGRRGSTCEGPEREAVPRALSPVCKMGPVWLAQTRDEDGVRLNLGRTLGATQKCDDWLTENLFCSLIVGHH